MRVAQVITSYHPIVGGAERQVAQLARLMNQRGHEATIVTRHQRGLATEEVIDGVPVIRVGAGGPKATAAPAFLFGAVARLNRLGADVIHCHSLWSPALAGSLSARRTGAALLAKPMRGGEIETIAGKPLGRRRIAHLARSVNAFPAVSQEIAAELAAAGVRPEKIRLIPNGVDTELFEPGDPAQQAALRLQLGLPVAGPLVLYAGRLSEQKRVPLLMAAWRRVHPRFPAATLLVAEARRLGDDTGAAVRAELTAMPGVHYLGHVDDMPSLLKAVDAFVIPSASEGMSNALLEACAAGVACVASDVGGNRDLFRSGENGLLFPSGDEAALVAALSAVLDSAELRGRLAAAARETIERHYGIAATCGALLDLYAEIVGEKARVKGNGPRG